MSNKYYYHVGNYPQLQKFWKKQVEAFWLPYRITFTVDIAQFREKLSDNQRNFISYILAFFSFADGMVIENLITRFYTDTPDEIKEAKLFYAAQMYIESIHSITYGMMLEALITDNTLLNKLRDAVAHYKCLERKNEWMKRYMNENISLIER